MADARITELAALTGAAVDTGDPLVIVDVSDTSMAATGTDKKITAGQLALAVKALAALGLAADAVILAPATSARNVIEPTDPDAIGLTVHTSGDPGLNAQGKAVLLTNGGDAVAQGLSCWEIRDDEDNIIVYIEADGNALFRRSPSANSSGAGVGFEVRSITNLALMAINAGQATFKTDNGFEFEVLTSGGSHSTFEVYDDDHIIQTVTTEPDDSLLQNGSHATWLDDTAGAPLLKIKAKDADGDVFTATIPLSPA